MPMRSISSWVCTFLTGTAVTVAPMAASSYPIDCAILLCLAGGFPASKECVAAKAEMIRRITPWPIEPPLQLWRCPMGGGSAAIPVGADGLPPEVRRFRDGVEIYDINYRRWRGGDDTVVMDGSRVGGYSGTGQFLWTHRAMQTAPSWVFDATGQSEARIKHQSGPVLRWRGVLLRWQDYQGRHEYEWVPY